MFMKSLLLLALGARTLSITHDWPWIGSFNLDDTDCTNTSLFTGSQASDQPARPEARDKRCAEIELQYGPDMLGVRVGGIWGTGDHQINIISVYMLNDCTVYQGNITRVGDQPGFCVPVADLSDLDNVWGSIKGGWSEEIAKHG